MVDISIRIAGVGDRTSWAAMRSALWPGEDDEHRAVIAAALAHPDPERLALIAHAGAQPVGFAEAAIRHDYVNGCKGSPVTFLEGIYVVEASRRQGVARRLVERVAGWGSGAGCREFASDAAADDRASHALHRALGFAETERVVFFRRMISS